MEKMKFFDRLRFAGNAILGRVPSISTQDIEKQPYIFGRINQYNGQKGIKLDFSLLYNIYNQNTTVKACVREWRDLVGGGGLVVRDKKTKKPLPMAQKIIDEILNYRKPGEVSTWETLRRNTWRDLGICDNAYWFLVRNLRGNKVIGVERIDPRTMSIVCDYYGNIYAYIQKLNANSEPIVFEPSEIIHFHTDISTENEMFGDSPINTIIYDALSDKEAVVSNYYFFKNNARPSTIFVLDKGLNEENTLKAIDQIKSQLKGSRNSGRGLTLKGVEKVESIELSRKDMQFLEGRAFTSEKISEAYDVPQFLLGKTDKVNNNNGQELRAEFYSGTIHPKEKLFAKQMTIGLLERIGMDNAEAYFEKQSFNQSQKRKEAQEEYERGLITLRQYKEKTGEPITPEDKKNPLLDAHVFIVGNPKTAEQISNTNSEQQSDPVPTE